MAWEAGKVVAGVYIHRSDESRLNNWVRFANDRRGWMSIVGGNREDDTAMLAVLSDARQSGRPVTVDVKCGFQGQYCVYGMYA